MKAEIWVDDCENSFPFPVLFINFFWENTTIHPIIARVHIFLSSSLNIIQSMDNRILKSNVGLTGLEQDKGDHPAHRDLTDLISCLMMSLPSDAVLG